MDKLEDWEINTLINYIPFADRNQWEQMRNQMYITAQVNSTKKLTPKDLIEFEWEKIHTVKYIDTQDDIDFARENAMELADLIQNGVSSVCDDDSVINMLLKDSLI